jgi:hypothetical protein
MVILDSPSERRHSFNLFWTLLDIRPDYPFPFNGNDPDASDSMPYNSLLADSFGFRDPAKFHPMTFRFAKGFSLFPSGLLQDLMQRLFSSRFAGPPFGPHDIMACFSPCPVFDARNLFLPVTFDLMFLCYSYSHGNAFSVCPL